MNGGRKIDRYLELFLFLADSRTSLFPPSLNCSIVLLHNFLSVDSPPMYRTRLLFDVVLEIGVLLLCISRVRGGLYGDFGVRDVGVASSTASVGLREEGPVGASVF